MKYFKIIKPPVEQRGTVPQSRRMIEGYNYLAENSVRKISHLNKIKVIPNFDAIQLEHRAKLTDWISSMNTINHSTFLICSEKLTDIILRHSVPKELQNFDAYILWRKKKYNYKALYSYNLNENLVDYSKSKFAIVDSFWNKKIENTSVIDVNELILKNREIGVKKAVVFQRISLRKELLKSDIFRLSAGGASGYYVSEKLKNAIEQAECTGIAFTPVEELNWVKE